jgi:hypothetical protein
MHDLHRSVLVHRSAHRRCRQLDEDRLASAPRFAGPNAASATLQIMIAEFEGGGDTAHTVSVSQLSALGRKFGDVLFMIKPRVPAGASGSTC